MKRTWMIAGAMLALTAAPAFAGGEYHPPSNDGGTKITNTQWQSQSQSQTTKNYNTANGGAGGNGYGGSASATGGAASSTATGGNASSSSSSSSNSGGNTQNVNQSDTLQAPAVSSFIAASGPCTGVSGGGALSFAGFGAGFSVATLEEDCKKRELLRIGFASGNAHVQAEAAQGYDMMWADAFGGGKPASQQTGSLPVATTTQTADASPAYCNANWPTVIKLAHGCN